MKKTTLALIAGTLILTGCSQIDSLKDQAQDLRKETVKTYNGYSEQVIDTKKKIDEKSQQLIDAANAVNQANEAIKKVSK